MAYEYILRCDDRKKKYLVVNLLGTNPSHFRYNDVEWTYLTSSEISQGKQYPIGGCTTTALQYRYSMYTVLCSSLMPQLKRGSDALADHLPNGDFS